MANPTAKPDVEVGIDHGDGAVRANQVQDSNGVVVVTTQQSLVADLTDNTGGSTGSALSAATGTYNATIVNDNFASVNAKLDAILDIFENHGLMSDT